MVSRPVPVQGQIVKGSRNGYCDGERKVTEDERW
jgi:hypothetical protein